MNFKKTIGCLLLGIGMLTLHSNMRRHHQIATKFFILCHSRETEISYVTMPSELKESAFV